MIETYFKRNWTQAAYQAEPIGPYLDNFTRWLEKHGYQQDTIRRRLRGATQFVAWAHSQSVPVPELNLAILTDFHSHLARHGQLFYPSGRHTARCAGAQYFLAFAQSEGIASAPPVAPSTTTLPHLLVAFEQWTRTHRGVTEQTLLGYRRYLVDLLHTLGDQPEQYEAKRLRAFILERVHQSRIGKAKCLTTAVRVFLRYLITVGHCPPGLDETIPHIAEWRLSTLPRYLPPEDVECVLAACDPATPRGARDRAILLLLARLGLRASDIAHLTFTDIEWDSAKVKVSGKSRREVRLPVPQEVGDALLHYLAHARPPHPDEHVFLTAVAPWRPLAGGGVTAIAARALHRAGVTAPAYGAHVFRHSAATAWLRQGASLQVIGDVLRHTSFETTAHYAKVDVGLLEQVTRPWPEVRSC